MSDTPQITAFNIDELFERHLVAEFERRIEANPEHPFQDLTDSELLQFMAAITPREYLINVNCPNGTTDTTAVVAELIKNDSVKRQIEGVD